MEQDGCWGGYTEIMAFTERFKRSVRLFVENPQIGLRPTDIEAEGGEEERVQLLLYKSHYWLLRDRRAMAQAF